MCAQDREYWNLYRKAVLSSAGADEETKAKVSEFLHSHGYSYTEPKDLGIFYNAPGHKMSLRRRIYDAVHRRRFCENK
jgi:hypothetical protein